MIRGLLKANERLWKVAKRLIIVLIGGLILFYGFHELQSGRWTGVIWVLIGPVFPYKVNRERWQKRVRAGFFVF